MVYLSNPLLIFFGIISVPYLLIGLFLQVVWVPLYTLVIKGITSSWTLFQLTASEGQMASWFPFIQLYCIFIPYTISVYRKFDQKKKEDEFDLKKKEAKNGN